ncbi:MAG TPA: phosphatase PAP2 family protein [Nocardioidaceae bacterium]|nr:phosphatase PAP2 family protein [Nocardioidaceae bacterium]
MHRSRRETSEHESWESEVSSGFAIAGFLALVFVAVTLLAIGPMAKLDAYFNLAPPPRGWLPALYALDRIGQRAVCLPILAVATFVVCRKHRTLRPAVVAVLSVFCLNLLVLLLKLGLGRGDPDDADPSFFAAGMAYPSGHSANIVLVYGLLGYLLLTYGDPGRVARILLWSIVPFLSILMVVTSLTLNWHWLTDLVSGLLVGGVVLQLTTALDRGVSATGFTPRWRKGVQDVRRRAGIDKSHGREDSV